MRFQGKVVAEGASPSGEGGEIWGGVAGFPVAEGATGETGGDGDEFLGEPMVDAEVAKSGYDGVDLSSGVADWAEGEGGGVVDGHRRRFLIGSSASQVR